jgi:hypothetical protein
MLDFSIQILFFIQKKPKKSLKVTIKKNWIKVFWEGRSHYSKQFSKDGLTRILTVYCYGYEFENTKITHMIHAWYAYRYHDIVTKLLKVSMIGCPILWWSNWICRSPTLFCLPKYSIYQQPNFVKVRLSFGTSYITTDMPLGTWPLYVSHCDMLNTEDSR